MCHDLPPLHLWRRLLLLAVLPGHPDLRLPRRRAGHPSDRPDPRPLRLRHGQPSARRCRPRSPRCRPGPPTRPPRTATSRPSSPHRCSRRPRRTSRSRRARRAATPAPQQQYPAPDGGQHGLRGDAAGRAPPRPGSRTRTQYNGQQYRGLLTPRASTAGAAGTMAAMGNAVLHSIHVHPVKALRGQSLREADVEPWGLAGDRRWVLVDDGGKVVTQREQPRLALAAAETLSGRRPSPVAPGRRPADGRRARAGRARRRVDIFGDKVEAVARRRRPRTRGAAPTSGTEVRLVHLDDPAVRRPVDPRVRAAGRDGEFRRRLSAAAHHAGLAGRAQLRDRARAITPARVPLPMNRFRPNVVVAGTEAWAEDGWHRVAVGEVVFRVAKPVRQLRRHHDRPGHRASAARSRCARSPASAASAGSWSSGRIWCPSPAARCASATRSRSSADPPGGGTPAAGRFVGAVGRPGKTGGATALRVPRSPGTCRRGAGGVAEGGAGHCVRSSGSGAGGTTRCAVRRTSSRHGWPWSPS